MMMQVRPAKPRDIFLTACSAIVFLALPPEPASAQASRERAVTVAQMVNEYRVVPEITYLTADGWDNRLDLFLPRSTTGLTPVVIYFHGGFWARGSRQASAMNVLPYLGMGWAAVNVSYRLGNVSVAPAAVEDALCAVRWVIRNAGEYGLDPSRIVVTGHSAGGHLALATAMLPASLELDARCAGNEPIEVAGVINWYGPTEVGEFLKGPHRQNLVVEWFGGRPDRFEVAERISPLAHVRRGLPPVLSIHGDADLAVPYSQATRLHEALEAAGVRHELHTVPGGGHGGFTPAETRVVFERIERFLDEVAGER